MSDKLQEIDRCIENNSSMSYVNSDVADATKLLKEYRAVVAENGLDVNFNWKDDECADIQCPNCEEDVGVSIYPEITHRCKCGKKYLLHQRNWVTEIVEKQPTTKEG